MNRAVLVLVAAWLASSRLAGAAELLQECETCPLMVKVEAGTFPRAENFDAEPVTVTVGDAFALGVCEVSVGEFRPYAEAAGIPLRGCTRYSTTGDKDYPEGGWDDPGFRQRDSRPVVCVTWEDAAAYAAWLSERTGSAYRLPSEAEWEYAARAGAGHESTWFVTGNLKAGQAKCATCFGSDVMGLEDELATANIGGGFRNAFGLADMLGNVAEWTADCNGPLSDAPRDGSVGESGDCAERITRGGAFHSDWAGIARYRVPRPAGEGRNDLGFRLVRELEGPDSDTAFDRHAESEFTPACR